MKKTKENAVNKKEKQKEKPTLGDIIFRVLVIFSIFLIALIFYTFYICTNA